MYQKKQKKSLPETEERQNQSYFLLRIYSEHQVEFRNKDLRD